MMVTDDHAEILRRMFSKWYALTKTNRHKRVTLQEREEDFKLYLLEKAWDRWRELFKEERLRPLVRTKSISYHGSS